jgi:hypothetical protein
MILIQFVLIEAWLVVFCITPKGLFNIIISYQTNFLFPNGDG